MILKNLRSTLVQCKNSISINLNKKLQTATPVFVQQEALARNVASPVNEKLKIDEKKLINPLKHDDFFELNQTVKLEELFK